MLAALWGDFCLHPRSRGLARIGDVLAAGACGGGPPPRPLAVTLVWERLWAVYESVLCAPDAARQAKILAALALPEAQLSKRDLACKDPRMRLQVSACVCGPGNSEGFGRAGQACRCVGACVRACVWGCGCLWVWLWL